MRGVWNRTPLFNNSYFGHSYWEQLFMPPSQPDEGTIYILAPSFSRKHSCQLYDTYIYGYAINFLPKTIHFLGSDSWTWSLWQFKRTIVQSSPFGQFRTLVRSGGSVVKTLKWLKSTGILALFTTDQSWWRKPHTRKSLEIMVFGHFLRSPTDQSVEV